MTFIVNDNCIKCKYTDCVEVCPVDCFYEGEKLVINPDECIDCGVCEPECPIEAILPDTDPAAEKWLDLNAHASGAVVAEYNTEERAHGRRYDFKRCRNKFRRSLLSRGRRGGLGF